MSAVRDGRASLPEAAVPQEPQAARTPCMCSPAQPAEEGEPTEGTGDAGGEGGAGAAESKSGQSSCKIHSFIMDFYFWAFSTLRFSFPVLMPFFSQPRGTGMSEVIPSSVGEPFVGSTTPGTAGARELCQEFPPISHLMVTHKITRGRV